MTFPRSSPSSEAWIETASSLSRSPASTPDLASPMRPEPASPAFVRSVSINHHEWRSQMSKVIDTITHGDLLTSKVNAHSLSVGDMVIIDLDQNGLMVPLYVVTHEIEVGWGQVPMMLDNLISGKQVAYLAEINQPIDRVTGA